MPIIFSPEDAARRIDELIKQSQSPAILQAIAYTIIALFFILHLYRALGEGNPHLVVEGVLRAGIAAALVRNHPYIVNIAVDWFAGMAALGQYVQGALGNWDQVNALHSELQRITELLNQGFGVGTVWDKLANLGTYIIYAFSATATHILFALFFAVTMLIYNFLVFMAMVTMVIAAFLAPLVLATPSSRFLQPFMWEWLQVVLHAGLVMFIAQAIMGVVVDQSLVKPISDFAQDLAKAQASGDIDVALQAAKIPIAALVGLGVGVFALLNVQGIASAFLGRVESVAGATAAAMFFTIGTGRLAGGRWREYWSDYSRRHAIPVPSTSGPPGPAGAPGTGGAGGPRPGGAPARGGPTLGRPAGSLDLNDYIPAASSFNPN